MPSRNVVETYHVKILSTIVPSALYHMVVKSLTEPFIFLAQDSGNHRKPSVYLKVLLGNNFSQFGKSPGKYNSKTWSAETKGSCVQNHWVAPRSTQPFILLRSIKWVPGISENLVVKIKLPPQSGSSLEAVLNPIHKKGPTKSLLKVIPISK